MRMHMHMHTRTHTHAPTHTRTHARTHTHTHTLHIHIHIIHTRRYVSTHLSDQSFVLLELTRFHVKLSKLPEIAFLCVNFVYFCAFLSFSGNFRQIFAGSPRIKGEMVSLWPGVRQGPSRSVKVGASVRHLCGDIHVSAPVRQSSGRLQTDLSVKVRQGPSRSVKVVFT